MSQILNNNAIHPKVQESIPNVMSYGQMPSANSVIVNRQTVKVQPLSGSVFGTTPSSLNEIQFRLNVPQLIDSQTIRLQFKHQATKADGSAPTGDGTEQLDDFAASVIESIVVRVAGQEVERISNYNLLNNVLSYYSMPAAYYENQANAAEGSYKLITDGPEAAQAWARAGRYYSVELHCGLFRQSKLLPPNLDVGLELNLATFASSHITTTVGGTASNAAAYKLTDVRLEYDQVDVFADWYKAYNKSIQSSNGVSFPIETYESIPSVVTTSGGSFLLSKGVKSLRTVLAVARLSADLSDASKPSLSKFSKMGLTGYQFRMAGSSYPQDYTDNDPEMFNETQKAFAQLGDISAGGLINYTRYTDANAGDPYFIIGQNFERSWESPFSGVNLRNEGYQLSLFMKNAGADVPTAGDSYQVTSFLHFMKIIDLSQGRMFVSE